MDYKLIYTPDEIRQYIGSAGIVAFDFETAPNDEWWNEPKAALDAHKAHIVGISMSVAEGSAVYIPLAHRVGVNAASPVAILERLREMLFENTNVVKVAHNLSFEAMFLYALGIIVCEPCYDTIAASQLTLKSKFEFRDLHDSGLKLLSTSLFGAEMPDFNTVTAGRHFDEMDPTEHETLRYACADSDYTLRLYHKFNGWFAKNLPQHRDKIKNDNMANDAFYNFLLAAFQNTEAVIADDASIYVFHSDTEGLNFRRAFSDAGFYLSGCCIWKKQSLVLGRSPYQWQHEPVLYGWKKSGKHQWYSGRKETTIWEFDKPKKNGDHPTMKPIPLLAYPIMNSSMSNTLVLDPFGDSGSTLIACEQADRSCATIELDEKYCDVIVKRYIEQVGSADKVSVQRDGLTYAYAEVAGKSD